MLSKKVVTTSKLTVVIRESICNKESMCSKDNVQMCCYCIQFVHAVTSTSFGKIGPRQG